MTNDDSTITPVGKAKCPFSKIYSKRVFMCAQQILDQRCIVGSARTAIMAQVPVATADPDLAIFLGRSKIAQMHGSSLTIEGMQTSAGFVCPGKFPGKNADSMKRATSK